MTATGFEYRLVDGPLLPTPGRPGRARRRRWAVGVLLVGLAGAGLVAAHRPLLVGFAGLFEVDDPAPSDALVVLLGGPGHRPAHAAKLYREGLAPVVLLASTGQSLDTHMNETEMYLRTLAGHGVPRSAIRVLPERTGSTADEARRVRTYVESHPMRRITVVSSGFHTARARWIFRRTLRDRGVEVRTAAAEHPLFTETTWYRSDEGLVLYFSEAIKTLYYWITY